ncbi:hypothetical protein M9Y10_034214 [Tritrichomonas musculus]|uniref:Rab-GAP TBC domain-containing protein n=1 Tax=Tritrichomonas musculus TaxID=1915356 RepID=A0ABR2KF05_9EUKA
MVEKFITEQQLADALYMCSGDIFNMVDILRFLCTPQLNKDNAMRFICYLITLKVMPLDRPKWIPSILKYGQYYQDTMKRSFEDCYTNPTEAVTGQTAKDIDEAIHKRFDWCLFFGYQLKVDRYYLQDAELRVKRLFCTYMLEFSKPEILPEYVTFAYASYMMGLLFAIQSGLPSFFAEAIGYQMFLALVKMNKYNHQMLELGYSKEHAEKFIDLFHYFCPKLQKEMKVIGFDVLDYVFHWDFTLYTEEHVPLNLLLVWDNIFFHIDEYQFYIRFLHIAHLRQMEKDKVDFTSKESIESIKWNAVEILKDCEDLMEKDIARVKFNYWAFCPCYNLCPHLSLRGKK